MTQDLLDVLSRDGSDMLSNRDIGRRTGNHHLFVAGYRAALAALGVGIQFHGLAAAAADVSKAERHPV